MRWLKLFLVAMVIGACAYLGSSLERLPLVGSAITTLRESGISVGAWYYDDVEEVFEAMDFIRETLGRDTSEG
ncbi:MAG: hypothetical protein P1P89_15600 [Desulfobacterales bacterium]|nr:hypothetical protein [Desulfobacterales bacterium]